MAIAEKWKDGKLRRVIYKRQGRNCCYCGKFMHLPKSGIQFSKYNNGPDIATLEHLQSVSEGGKDVPDNYAIACRTCNELRGKMQVTWIEFATIISCMKEQHYV